MPSLLIISVVGNPLSKNFDEIEKIPPLIEIFNDSKLNLHLDIGSASGEFLFELALENTSWNFIGIEIRERLVKKAKLKGFISRKSIM